MPMTPERAAAHEQLDAAVDNIIKVYGTFREGQFLLGWSLIVGGTRMMTPELDGDFFDPEEGDEEEFVTTSRMFHKRGQQPVVSRGLMEYAIDQSIRNSRDDR